MKVKIELTPYNAMTILAFLKEYEEDIVGLGEQGKALHGAVKEYEAQIYENITDKELDDCDAENQVNQLIGKSPKR